MKKTLSIFKIGGNVVDNATALEQFLADFSNVEGLKILIHGGGKIATKISNALGIKTQMINGRRVTDKETVKVVTMVYAGLVNKSIVAQLQALNVNTIGLSGADANVIQSHKRTGSEIDYGFVGDVDQVNHHFISNQLTNGYTLVFAPITHDKKGQLLNTNADTIASEISIAMSQEYHVTLNYCFELPGVLKNIEDLSSIIDRIDPKDYTQLKKDGVIADGMIPKLDNCFHAIDKGVNEVRIIHANDINKQEAGTKLVAS